MTANEILRLEIGSRISYAGKIGTVVDFTCRKDPFFMDGTRVDAEPIFSFEYLHPHSVHPAYWNEIKPA